MNSILYGAIVLNLLAGALNLFVWAEAGSPWGLFFGCLGFAISGFLTGLVLFP